MKDVIIEIPVTPQMVDAGLHEMREHHYETDVRWMLESVFRAMVYARLDAEGDLNQGTVK